MLMPECGILTKVTEPPPSFSIRGRFSGWNESCTTWITPCYWSSLKGGCCVFTWQIFRNLPIFVHFICWIWRRNAWGQGSVKHRDKRTVSNIILKFIILWNCSTLFSPFGLHHVLRVTLPTLCLSQPTIQPIMWTAVQAIITCRLKNSVFRKQATYRNWRIWVFPNPFVRPKQQFVTMCNLDVLLCGSWALHPLNQFAFLPGKLSSAPTNHSTVWQYCDQSQLSSAPTWCEMWAKDRPTDQDVKPEPDCTFSTS